jgi:hypothetical protein
MNKIPVQQRATNAVLQNDYETLIACIKEDPTAIKNTSFLYIATRNNYIETVKVLLDNGFNVNTGNNLALQQAATNGHVDVVKLLLDRGADKNAIEDYTIKQIKKSGFSDVLKVLCIPE